MSLNIHDTGGSPSSINKPASTNPNDDLIEQANILLKQFRMLKLQSEKGTDVSNSTGITGDVSTSMNVDPTEGGVNASLRAQNQAPASNNPSLPAASNINPPVGQQGLGNPWLKPSLTGILFALILQANAKMMESKLFEGLQGAEYIVKSGEVAVAEGQAIIAKAQKEAAEHLMSAAMAFGSAAGTIAIVGYTQTSQSRATKEIDKEMALLQDNPNSVVDRSRPGARLPGAPATGDVETYFANKATLKSGVDPVTGVKLTEAQRGQLIDQNAKIKPGVKQLEEWQAGHGGSPIEADVIAEKAALEKQINRYYSPEGQAETNEKIEKRANIYRSQASVYTQILNETTKGIDELNKSVMKVLEAGYEQQKILLQNEQSNIRTMMETAHSAQKEISDTISEFTKWLIQYSENVTRRFGFSR